jgi:integrase/recombinase XerD
MREHTHAGMSLYGSAGSRKYLNAAERRRFAKAALRTPLEVQLFCIVLSLTGGRISEILAVTPAAIDIDSGVVNIVTLKRRKRGPASPLAPERYR